MGRKVVRARGGKGGVTGVSGYYVTSALMNSQGMEPPSQDQAVQHSSMERKAIHEPPTLMRWLLGEGESIFFKGVDSGRLTMLQKMATYS